MNDWRDQAERRVWRVLLPLAVGAVAAAFVVTAWAQAVCSDVWRLDNGSGFEATLSGDFCTAEEARLSAQGYHAGSCVSTGTSATYVLLDGANAPVENRSWVRLPIGCAVPGGGTGGTAGSVTLVLPAAFSLSAEDGAILGVAIVSVWLAAFAWRAAMRALDVADGNYDDE